jgi:hypothetical protein
MDRDFCLGLVIKYRTGWAGGKYGGGPPCSCLQTGVGFHMLICSSFSFRFLDNDSFQRIF